MTLSMVMRSRAPDGRSASECKGKPLRSHPGLTYGHQNAGRRPGTKADLSGRSENRYDPPRVQGSSGESRNNFRFESPSGPMPGSRGRHQFLPRHPGVIFFSAAYFAAASLTMGAIMESSAVIQSDAMFHFLPS